MMMKLERLTVRVIQEIISSFVFFGDVLVHQDISLEITLISTDGFFFVVSVFFLTVFFGCDFCSILSTIRKECSQKTTFFIKHYAERQVLSAL